jgi:hypothetical protein
LRTNQRSIARDAALRRLGNVNRLLAAGSLVAAGVLTDVAANAFPGHSPASLRAAAVAAQRAHKQQCFVCAPGRTTIQPPPSTQSNSQGAEGSAAPAPAPAPAPVVYPAPVVMSGGS